MNKKKLFLWVPMSLLIMAGLYFVVSYKVFSRHKLNEKMLEISLEKGKEFLLNNQRPSGNFTYEFNYVDEIESKEDNQVRQAGALWGLSLINAYKPDEITGKAVLKGIGFFMSSSHYLDDGRLSVVYKNEQMSSLGTTALFALSITELMHTNPDIKKDTLLMAALRGSIKTILSLRMPDGRFYSYYSAKNLFPVSSPNPYADGEALLALVKAYDLIADTTLKPLILESAEIMYRTYIVEAQKKDKDSDLSKGFYQWGTMAYYEIFIKGWKPLYAGRITGMAYWMIDVHKTLLKTKNTAYAMEGLAHAYHISEITGNEKAMKKTGRVIDKALFKLITWQVNGPRENWYLKLHPATPKPATGGIMNFCCDKNLRIDVTQHQMHATILALKYLFGRE